MVVIRSPRVAWALGLAGAVGCTISTASSIGLGIADQLFTSAFGLAFGVLMGVLGALIAVRQPRNSIGWLMCGTSLATSLVTLPTNYAYAALVTTRGALPLGTEMLWFATWASIPVFGVFLPFILARFPDGRVRARWRFAGWLAVLGTGSWVLSIALSPNDVPLAPPRVEAALLPFARNPFGFSAPMMVISDFYMGGLATIVAAYIAAAAALVARFRVASHEDAIRLKWFAYAGTLVAITVVYAGIAWDRGVYLGDALVPFELTVVALPVAIGIAILRYQLFDIDLIINRTLVYVGVTATLGALYTAVLTFVNRYFIAATGQKSDAAYVITAFAVVAAFGPLKDWLQRRVDRRLGGATASAALDRFAVEVETVVAVMDVRRVACMLVDTAVIAFDARGAAVYVESEEIYCRGHMNGDPVLEFMLRHDGRSIGRLVLGTRRGDAAYSRRDREALQRSADSVGEALALATRFGHRPRVAPAR